MKIGEYLIEAMKNAQTRHVFGIQGDYILKFFNELSKSSLKLINTCDEQGAGFAADAYARVNGFGAVCVTYCVGGLKLANTTGQAFAEMSPVLVISGAPGMSERNSDPLLHHKVASFDTQLNVFREMTCAQAVLGEPKTAAEEIDRVIKAIKDTKRPGYIELPRDMVQVEIGETPPKDLKEIPINKTAVDKAVQEIVEMINKAERPMVIAGIEVHRFGLQKQLLKFIEGTNMPFATGILSKSVLPEMHPQFIGVYAGAMSPDIIKEKVEGSDCIIVFGPLISDFATGIFNFNIDQNNTVIAHQEKVTIRLNDNNGVKMETLLSSLIDALPKIKKSKLEPTPLKISPFKPVKGQKITTHGMTNFISPSYYASTGFAVPASVGAQLACPEKRPIVLEGDGSFQMTGMELSTAARYGLNPIVIVLNNGGYSTFRPMIDEAFDDLYPWQYSEITKVLGQGKGFRVQTEDELVLAINEAKENKSAFSIIDVILDKNDYSSRSNRLTLNLNKKIK